MSQQDVLYEAFLKKHGKRGGFLQKKKARDRAFLSKYSILFKQCIDWCVIDGGIPLNVIKSAVIDQLIAITEQGE